jgi:hypothetical protein
MLKCWSKQREDPAIGVLAKRQIKILSLRSLRLERAKRVGGNSNYLIGNCYDKKGS